MKGRTCSIRFIAYPDQRAVLILLFLVPFLSFAQKRDTVLRYLNQKLEFTNAKSAVFYGVSVKREDWWYLHVLYPDTSTLISGYYKDRDLKIRDGSFTTFFPGYRRASYGTYSDNEMNGNWIFWYENGQLKDSGDVERNYTTGHWKSWFEDGKIKTEMQFRTSLNPEERKVLTLLRQPGEKAPFPGVLEGAYQNFYPSGVVESKGWFSNNVMDSTWEWYHPNGSVSSVEQWKEGRLGDIRCYDSTGSESTGFCSVARPAVLKEHGDYKEYVYRNLIWPQEALKKNIEGTVTVRFRITREGQLTDLKVEGGHPVLQETVRELFAGLKDWYPAVSHNRVLETAEELEIPFYRNR